MITVLMRKCNSRLTCLGILLGFFGSLLKKAESSWITFGVYHTTFTCLAEGLFKSVNSWLTSHSPHWIFGSDFPKPSEGQFLREGQVNKVSWAVCCPCPALFSVVGEGQYRAVDRWTVSLPLSGAFSMLQLGNMLFSFQAETQVPAAQGH